MKFLTNDRADTADSDNHCVCHKIKIFSSLFPLTKKLAHPRLPRKWPNFSQPTPTLKWSQFLPVTDLIFSSLGAITARL